MTLNEFWFLIIGVLLVVEIVADKIPASTSASARCCRPWARVATRAIPTSAAASC